LWSPPMAKIQEQVVVIRLSKLMKGDQKMTASIIDPAILTELESVVSELAGDPSVIVEIGSDADDAE